MSQYYSHPNHLLTFKKVGAEYMQLIIDLVYCEWQCNHEMVANKKKARYSSEPFHVITTLILEFIEPKITYSDFRDEVAVMFNRKRSDTYHAQKTVSNLEFSNIKFFEKMTCIRIDVTNKIYQEEQRKLEQLKHKELIEQQTQ